VPEPWDTWWPSGGEEYCAKEPFFPRFLWCFFRNTLFLFVYNVFGGYEMSLKDGFMLGDWVVQPLQGTFERNDSIARVQPKSMDVLLVLASRSPSVVERDELLREVWHERAVSDEPLTRCIGELRRALGDTRGEPEYILTVPKRGYQLLQPATPLPEEDDDSSANGAEQLTESQATLRINTVKKIAAALGVLLVAAAIEVGFERWLESGDRNAADDQQASQQIEDYGLSIAVLPFDNMSSDAEQEFFSDGISEELLNLLAKFPDLRVISRTSAFTYKDKDIDIPTIASELRVTHILEGSVRRSNDLVRITAQLIDARNDSHIWSETYEKTLDDIFATQDEIARKVAEQLKLNLLGDDQIKSMVDPRAFALVLQARYVYRQFTSEAIANTIDLYKQALAIEPNYAEAWTGLASAYIRQADQGLIPVDQGFALARSAAEAALGADPTYARAYGRLGRIAMTYDRDFTAAAQHYRNAFVYAPTDVTSLNDAATMAAFLGRLDLAISLRERAAERDPVSPVGSTSLGLYYLHAGRIDEAIAAFEAALTLNPNFRGVKYLIGTALLLRGEAESALTMMEEEPSDVWRMIGLPMAYYATGQVEAADEALAVLVEKYGEDAAYNIAYVYAFRNQPDEAFNWLEKAVDFNDSGLSNSVIHALLANIREDNRWEPFLASIGMSPATLNKITFDLELPTL
jgi:TolB-like protein/DNA-binding winged helix-turn-helix (wHTH) protein/Tfp pilus assembly protein PilF